MSDFMCDLETLDNRSSSVIIAIGAVKFDPKTKQIIDRFYARIDPQSCLDAGLTVSGSTILWWMQQHENARSQFKGILPPLKTSLNGFSAWMQKIPGEIGSERVWGNGATFDNVILTNAYNAIGLARPWSYKGDRCYRTIRSLYPDVPFKDYGTAHRADHDAEAQALHLMEIWPKLRAA